VTLYDLSISGLSYALDKGVDCSQVSSYLKWYGGAQSSNCGCLAARVPLSINSKGMLMAFLFDMLFVSTFLV
jgi:hypothetical protein